MAHAGGFKTAQEYADAIEREVSGVTGQARRYPENEPAERKQPRQLHPGEAAKIAASMQARDPLDPRKALAGLSHQERLDVASEIAGPEITGAVVRQQQAEEVADTLKEWYMRGAVEEDLTAADRLAQQLVDANDPELAAGVAQALENVGADYMLDSIRSLAQTKVQLLSEQEQKRRQEHYEAHVANRELLLQDELNRLDPRDAEPVAKMMDANPQAFYYDEPIDVVMAARTIGEQSRAQRQAGDAFNVVAAIHEEVKRGIGAPALNDAERRQWERDLDEGAVEVFDRKAVEADPLRSYDRAERTVLNADQDPFAASIVRELGEMIERQEPEHQTVERLRERSPENYLPEGERGTASNPEFHAPDGQS